MRGEIAKPVDKSAAQIGKKFNIKRVMNVSQPIGYGTANEE